MITRILLFLLLLLLFPLWGIDKQILRKKSSLTTRFCFAIPNILLSIILCICSFNESYSSTADTIKSITLGITLLIGVPESIFCISIFLLSYFYKTKERTTKQLIFSSILPLCTFGLLISGFTFGSHHVICKEVKYSSTLIPKSFNNYKIVFISDLHLGTFRFYPQVIHKIVYTINAQKPDLIVFGGDLVNYSSLEINPFISLLKEIKAKDGVISIMGNHDYMTYINYKKERERVTDIKRLQNLQKSIDWKLLLNQSYTIKRGKDSIIFVGLENEGNRSNFPKKANLKKALQNINVNNFIILLQHDPSYWRQTVIPKTNIPLTLSGHTHAMQFKVFNWSPAKWFYPEWNGFYHYKNQSLFVSPGIGSVLLPFRWGAWPEIDIITLSSK